MVKTLYLLPECFAPSPDLWLNRLIGCYNCYKIAKRKGKRVVEIINTGRGILPIICIFEGKQDD
ncbi:hypothetical protein [Argonema galeatum]|uniref:hypothetical protein n=1 Tax=Argonema galeatum TaxID=2942762 RepID=UPI002010E0DF|nr:hypothetical protein [Argonema galeatum]MCL1467951.1 hypothetical protein [Argonema galeatum A003/A1]